MPRVSRWFVRSSMVYLAIGLLSWWALAAAQAGWLPASLAAWAPAYVHFLTVGWLSQLIFGVAHWMLPMYSKDLPRGHESLMWVAWVCINVGLPLRAVAEPFAARQPGSLWGWIVVLSALLQWLAGILFLVNTWPRVKPRRA